MPNIAISSLLKFMSTCKDDTVTTPNLGTKVSNLTDRPIEVQIRVGSILKKAHTLKPGSSRRLHCKAIYKAYMLQNTTFCSRNEVACNNNSKKCVKKKKYMYYNCDESSMPYVWIHESGGNFYRMVKQQYLSLEDLRECCEIRVYRDHQRGCICVRKMSRSEIC